MKTLSQFQNSGVKFLFTDIDDTLTDEGMLHAEAYTSLWDLHDSGVQIVPVTGRPAGWCEMIARFWPVAGVIGENGGLYFRYLAKERKMLRHFAFDEDQMRSNRLKLQHIQEQVLKEVPGCAIASDQFCRMMDLAVDFAEDVGPLSDELINKIVDIFESRGATAKVSSIHVNGWFGNYDKLSMCRQFAAQELKIDLDSQNSMCAFTGDSPNDEPMFGFFKNSFAVANIQKFASRLKQPPKFVASKPGGDGFVEIAKLLLK